MSLSNEQSTNCRVVGLSLSPSFSLLRVFMSLDKTNKAMNVQLYIINTIA